MSQPDALIARFYKEALDPPLNIDQGWCEISHICPGARCGQVDENRRMGT